MNDLDQRRIIYFNRCAEGWDERLNTRKTIPRLREQLAGWELPQTGRILDIGCGTGVLTRALVPLLSRTGRVEAIDFSPGMIRQAARNLPDARVMFRIADARELPYENDCFDAVLVFSTLPHIDPISVGLEEFARVLKPGGVLHIWHLLNRDEVNAIHARVDPSVVSDILPPATELGSMMHKKGFTVQALEDSADLYHVSGIFLPNR